MRRSTRKTPNKYRRKSTVSRSSTSEENEAPVVVQPNKVKIIVFVVNIIYEHGDVKLQLNIVCYLL